MSTQTLSQTCFYQMFAPTWQLSLEAEGLGHVDRMEGGRVSGQETEALSRSPSTKTDLGSLSPSSEAWGRAAANSWHTLGYPWTPDNEQRLESRPGPGSSSPTM